MPKRNIFVDLVERQQILSLLAEFKLLLPIDFEQEFLAKSGKWRGCKKYGLDIDIFGLSAVRLICRHRRRRRRRRRKR